MVTTDEVLVGAAESLRTWLPFLLLISVSVLVGYVFERIVIRSLKRMTKHTRTDLDDVIVRAVHPALVLLVAVAGFWFGLRYLAAVPLPVIAWGQRISFAFVALLVALIVSRTLSGLVNRRAEHRPQWRPIARLGGRVVSTVIYIVAFLVILDTYGVSITPLITSLGIAGLAVALALQDTLANFFAGVWIQAGRGLQPGHYVRLEGENLEGYIDDIGWRTTKIRTLPNNMILVPNAKLAQTIVTNYHLPSTRMSLLIPISVGYEADPRRVEALLVEEAKKGAKEVPGLLEEPEPFVRFIPGFGDYALQFTLICQVREFVDQYLAQHELRKRILDRFRAEGIRIPYPTREHFQIPPDRADVQAPAPSGPGTGRQARPDAG